MERISIQSFLNQGHPYDLFVYGPVENVPSRANLCDAGEILPESRIFRYQETGSYAGFANFFRYKMLLERGGWWVDTDVICLKPFQFETPHVFATEEHDQREVLSSGIIRAPKGSAAMRFAWQTCDSLEPTTLRWGQTGSALVAEVVERFELQSQVQPPTCFCPVPYPKWEDVLSPDVSWNFGQETHAIHLWNEMWRRAGRGKDETYPEGCLYETLKQRNQSKPVNPDVAER